MTQMQTYASGYAVPTVYPSPPAPAQAQAPAPFTLPIQYTAFNHAEDATVTADKSGSCDWPEFTHRLKGALAFTAREKERLPMLVPAVWKGQRRLAANVVGLTLGVLDLDNATGEQFAGLVAFFTRLNLAACIYTTPGDNGPGGPRKLRVVLPVDELIPAAESKRLRKALALLLGVEIDTTTFDPARGFFVGQVYGTPARELWISPGANPLPVAALLAGVPTEPEVTASAHRDLSGERHADMPELTPADRQAAAEYITDMFADCPTSKNSAVYAFGGLCRQWGWSAEATAEVIEDALNYRALESGDVRSVPDGVASAMRGYDCPNQHGWMALRDLLGGEGPGDTAMKELKQALPCLPRVYGALAAHPAYDALMSRPAAPAPVAVAPVAVAASTEAARVVTCAADFFRSVPRAKEVKPLATSIPSLDELLEGGLARNTRWVIGGAPDTGKTAAVAQTAEHIASQCGGAVGYLAVDEDVHTFMARRLQMLGVLRSEARLHYDEMADGTRAAVAELDAGRVLKVYDARTSVGLVFADLAQRYPDRERLVCVDSLHACARASAGAVQDDIAKIGNLLSAISAAQEAYPATVLLTGELNRDAYKSRKSAADADPLAALKGSGEIEYWATGILVLTATDVEGEIAVAVAKNKQTGRRHKLVWKFDRARLTFSDAPERVEREESPMAITETHATIVSAAFQLLASLTPWGEPPMKRPLSVVADLVAASGKTKLKTSTVESILRLYGVAHDGDTSSVAKFPFTINGSKENAAICIRPGSTGPTGERQAFGVPGAGAPTGEQQAQDADKAAESERARRDAELRGLTEKCGPVVTVASGVGAAPVATLPVGYPAFSQLPSLDSNEGKLALNEWAWGARKYSYDNTVEHACSQAKVQPPAPGNAGKAALKVMREALARVGGEIRESKGRNRPPRVVILAKV